MNHSELKLLTDRFDKVDQDNAAIKKDVSTIKADVARHSMYWDITKYAVPGALASFLSYLGLTSNKH